MTDNMRSVAVADHLSRRERDVLALMADGLSNGAISCDLWLSPKTVETHVRSIFAKLELRPGGREDRRVAAVLAFLRSSLPAGSGPGHARAHDFV